MTTDQQRDHIRTHQELNRAFMAGEIFEAAPEKHVAYLKHLGVLFSDLHISDERVAQVNVARTLTINHIQMARVIGKLEKTIERLNAENGEVSRNVLILTWVTVLIGAIQVIAAVLN